MAHDESCSFHSKSSAVAGSRSKESSGEGWLAAAAAKLSLQPCCMASNVDGEARVGYDVKSGACKTVVGVSARKFGLYDEGAALAPGPVA